MRLKQSSKHQVSPIERLENTLREAREVCALAHNPIEWRPPGSFLGAIILSKLGLGPQQDADGQTMTGFTYTLHLPSAEEGVAWWEATLFHMTRHNNETQQRAEARLIASEQQQRVKLFRVAPYVCGVPTIVVNPRDHTIEGFNAYSTPKRTSPLSVACADPISMERWKATVFVPLEIGVIPRQPIPCPF